MKAFPLLVLALLLAGCTSPAPSTAQVPPASEGASNGVGSRLTNEEAQRLVELHDKARADVGVGPMTWSPVVAVYAQAWADHLADTCEMRHRPHEGPWAQQYGENLFMGTAEFYGVGDAAAGWESEKADYHGEPISKTNVAAVGHYTQMVWHETTELGCAKSTCGDEVLVVCNYHPAGNYLGEKPY